MTDPDPKPAEPHDWEGLREIDRAITENRLTAYTWQKAWADPWQRLKLIVVAASFLAFAIFVVVYDVIL